MESHQICCPCSLPKVVSSPRGLRPECQTLKAVAMIYYVDRSWSLLQMVLLWCWCILSALLASAHQAMFSSSTINIVRHGSKIHWTWGTPPSLARILVGEDEKSFLQSPGGCSCGDSLTPCSPPAFQWLGNKETLGKLRGNIQKVLFRETQGFIVNKVQFIRVPALAKEKLCCCEECGQSRSD